MNKLIIEGNMDGLGVMILLILLIMFGIPIILAIIGAVQWSRGKKKAAKVLFIIAVVYLLISLGICGSMMI